MVSDGKDVRSAPEARDQLLLITMRLQHVAIVGFASCTQRRIVSAYPRQYARSRADDRDVRVPHIDVKIGVEQHGYATSVTAANGSTSR